MLPFALSHLAQGQGKQVLLCNSRPLLFPIPEPDPAAAPQTHDGHWGLQERSSITGGFSWCWWSFSLSCFFLFQCLSLVWYSLSCQGFSAAAHPRILCCCPSARWLPSALVSHRLLLGNSSSIWGSLGPVCGCFPAPCASLSPQAESDTLCSSALLLLRSSSSSRGI